MDKINKIIATFFYTGYLPIAPGTWASLFTTVILFFVFKTLTLPMYLFLLVFIFIIGSVISDYLSKKYNVEDPRWIVIDEVVGIMVTFLPLYYHVVFNYKALIVGFFLFRIFDVIKPFPVSWADKRIKNGFGIMFDDVLAGVYSAIILFLLRGYLV